jgi:hypothetical protein
VSVPVGTIYFGFDHYESKFRLMLLTGTGTDTSRGVPGTDTATDTS